MSEASAVFVLTDPQYAILEAAARRGGCDVFGRQMMAVDNLEKAGLVTASWRIAQGGQQTRWNGRARATAEGRKIVKRPRPAIPLWVQCTVALRQLGEMWPEEVITAHERRLEALLQDRLYRLAGLLGCDVDDLRLDHDPALALRPYDRKVKDPAARYTPHANDPDALRWRPQGRQFDGSHCIKTNVRGERGQLSDTALRKKLRKIEKKKARPKIAKRRSAFRPLRSANRWPPRGSRKIRNRAPKD